MTQNSSTVHGLAIHPDASSICVSAIIDKSIPTAGGIIGMGIFKGLDNYAAAGIVMGVSVKSYERAKKSFITFKGNSLILKLNNNY